mgnify:CR=1 FL=1
MKIKSSSQLVQTALSQIKTISTEQAFKLFNEDKCNLIDIREKGELDKMGKVENSNHIPRGMLEFWIDPESPYHKEIFSKDTNFVFYCASAWRSALSTKAAKEMGLYNVCHLEGGFTNWEKSGGKIEKLINS